MQNFRALGALPPGSPASRGWRLRRQTPIGLQRLGALPPDPQNSPPMRISGYAPALREESKIFRGNQLTQDD